MVLFTQYTHPGGTHNLSVKERKTGVKQWNYANGHRQKFVNTFGDCIDENGNITYNQNLLFWNEWEPLSTMHPIDRFEGVGVMPPCVHRPILEVDENGIAISPKYDGKTYTSHGVKYPRIRQNSDPFIYDEKFHYCRCKQRSFTTLKNMDHGSLMLFGSTISKERGGPYYVIDTVFVVEQSKPYYAREYKRDLGDYVSDDYAQIIGFEQTEHPEVQFSLYKGANPQNPINGMFSFVPCKRCTGELVGFPKVRIDSERMNALLNKQIIVDNLNCSPKYTLIENPDDCKLIWDEVRKQVHEQGFLLGFNFKYDRRIIIDGDQRYTDI